MLLDYCFPYKILTALRQPIEPLEKRKIMKIKYLK